MKAWRRFYVTTARYLIVAKHAETLQMIESRDVSADCRALNLLLNLHTRLDHVSV